MVVDHGLVDAGNHNGDDGNGTDARGSGTPTPSHAGALGWGPRGWPTGDRPPRLRRRRL